MKIFNFEIERDDSRVSLDVVAETAEQAQRFAAGLEKGNNSRISSPSVVGDANDDANQYEYRYY